MLRLTFLFEVISSLPSQFLKGQAMTEEATFRPSANKENLVVKNRLLLKK